MTQSTASIPDPHAGPLHDDHAHAGDAAQGGHGHSHPAHVAHHFDDAEQQKDAATLGMWCFLATEVLFFGGLFLGYAIYRQRYPEAFLIGSHHLKLTHGTVNTFILLFSSLTVALSVHAAATGNRKGIVRYLIGTLILGFAFLGVKASEYYGEYQEKLIPKLLFELPDPAHSEHMKELLEHNPRVKAAYDDPVRRKGLEQQLQLFFVFYFCMTGLHASHMIIGIGVMSWLTWRAHKGHFSAEYHTPIEISGLYWHFVDIVWIFLFPMTYLLRH